MKAEIMITEEIEPPSLKNKTHNVVFLNRKAFYKHFFKNYSSKDFNDWHWQLSHRITTLDQLEKFVKLSRDELDAFHQRSNRLPMAITPYYLSLIEPNNFRQPLRKAILPSKHEFIYDERECNDPLGEEAHSPVHGLVHRYPDRVLFLVTNYCSVYCRYCTRSRMVGDELSREINKKDWENAIQYIASHPEIRDVVVSGGDPLTLEDEQIEWLLQRLRAIPHIQMIRIGSKVPVVLPQRITPALCKILKKYHPLYLSLHFTHPDELTEETQKACNRLADAGIPMGSQTVLLKGINDDVDVMKDLMHGMLKIRVRPYYIFQCDPIVGSQHFRTSVSKGIDLIKGLRGFTSGYAVPSYVIDTPNGGGKVPLLPEYYQGKKDGYVLLKNYEGKIYRYPDSE